MCNVMIKKFIFFKIYWIVKIKMNKFGINVEIYIFVDLGIDFCCCVVMFIIIIFIMKIIILV